MKNLNRRRFLKRSLVGAALATTGQSAFAGSFTSGITNKQSLSQQSSNRTSTELKLSFQEGIAPGRNLREKLDYK